MGLIVAGIGLTGTAYVIGYLHDRLTVHGIEHNKDIAERLRPLLLFNADDSPELSIEALQRRVATFGAFGYRIFVIDRRQRQLLADSHGEQDFPVNFDVSWLTDLTDLERSPITTPPEGGPAMATGEDGHSMLMWFTGIVPAGAQANRYLLGIASDQKNLTEFLGDLHWHLDGVLVLTYVLIALLSYFAMRSIGRAYERMLEAQVRERTVALEAAHAEVLTKTRLATIGQTASVLAHEMRNPLASIKLALSALQGEDSVPERTQRRVGLVVGEVDRLDAMLSETLDYVRPIRLSTKPIVLDQLLSQVIREQTPLLEARRLSLTRQTCAECTAIRLDEEKMHQVFLNLLKNAIEASTEGGEIGVQLFRDETSAVLEISNSGEPMTAETLERAFEPFYTTKSRGSGLGLGLVKRVVEEHGGSVTLASQPSTGTRVTLRLPINAQ